VSSLVIGGIGVLALFALILAQVPIGFAMIIVGVAGFALQTDWQPALTLLASEPSGVLANVDLAAVPLFLLMGTFTSVAGFSSDIYRAAAAMVGHRRGGLAYATIGGCAAFGAVCGSSTATAAMFSRAALPEMLRHGYSRGFSAGTIAAGGTLKCLIPPSIVMILYCIVAKAFVLDLFLAAVLPALLAVALNMLAVAVVARVRPDVAPTTAAMAWPERLDALRSAGPALGLMAAIFVGLYSGVFTINEAASVAAVLSFVFAALRRRLTWLALWQGLREAASATAMIYTVIIGALVFTYFVTLARVPEALVEMAQSLPLGPTGLIVVLLAGYLVLGAIFDEISAMLITLPFVLPLVVTLGYDPLWWGIVSMVVIELGMIIPPIGLIVFVLHGMRPDIPLRTIYAGVSPYILANLVLLALLVAFPIIALWLPAAIRG
jgi:C4-dicarboxylate transporter DctM subunit